MRRVPSSLLWLAAFLLMGSAAVYQRMTGPSHPRRGTFQVAGQPHAYRFLRSHETTGGAEVSFPDLGSGVRGELRFRRFPTQEPWTVSPLVPQADGRLVARLPVQPAAGKVEYAVQLHLGEGRTLAIPEEGAVVLRYRDPVPGWLLVSHVLCMFVGMMTGLRTALAAFLEPDKVRGLVFWTLGLLTLGGMVLGPFVQKFAFGAYWTGWPLGGDLTDDKTALLWLAWVGTGAAAAFLKASPRLVRTFVWAATCLMLAVYLVPHSLRGSQLDHAKGQIQTGAQP